MATATRERGSGLEQAAAIPVAGEVVSSGWAGPAPDVTVVIPTYERPAFLADALAALEAQSYPRDRFEVVIVDDASSDASWQAAAAAGEGSPLRLRAMTFAANSGPAAGRNAGVLAGRAPVIAFLDDDCRPAPRWIDALAGAIGGGADLVQGRTVPEPEALAVAGPWDRSIWVTGPSWLFETCNIAYRRSAFEALGGFDVARPEVTRGSRPHFGEDAALAYHRVYPGRYADWLREQRRRSLFPRVVRSSRGMRRGLFLRIFLSRETAAFDLAAAGGLAAAVSRNPLPLVAAVPWAWTLVRRARAHPKRALAVRVGQYAVGDAVGLAALVKGSAAARAPVL
jgi:glycosyltransferase involved in cell wall biosynthesis